MSNLGFVLDKALDPKNSYKIASTFLNRKRGSAKKSVYDYVDEGNFATARARVKGSSKGWEEVKQTYDKWLSILQRNHQKVDKKAILIISGSALIVGLMVFLIISKND